MDIKTAIAAMQNLGVSLNDYDSKALEVLCDFAEEHCLPPVHERLAELLTSIGWRSSCDAQWTNLRDALPQIKAML
jgi:hypothetical protein